MYKLSLKALLLGLFLVTTALLALVWFAGKSCFILLKREKKSLGVWFYILFTGGLALAAGGALLTGVFKIACLFAS